MNDKPEVHDKVALRVILFLGLGMLLGLAGVILLVHESIQSANEVDPSTVALVSGVSTLVGMGFGALGAILGRPATATPAAPAGTPTDPVNVTLPDEPVQVTPVPADVHPDAPDSSDL
jgi:hypothetical protein